LAIPRVGEVGVCNGQSLDWFWLRPRRREEILRPGFFDPVDGERTGVRKIFRTLAEVFSNWIGPNVAGDSFERIGFSQDMVIEAHGPELTARTLLELERGALLEDADEFQEIGNWFDAMCEEMEMVRHGAEGMEAEGGVSRRSNESR